MSTITMNVISDSNPRLTAAIDIGSSSFLLMCVRGRLSLLPELQRDVDHLLAFLDLLRELFVG
ncbi:MAG: hypothetical protein IRY96_04025, partial [Burkholderiales bacterium]|nr:hypothetical protein [Burkholderiales bacterium]